jgi:hypothetical protein
MVSCNVTLPLKCEEFLQKLANDHQIEVSNVLSELCVWAFSFPEGKKQFESWLDDAFPSRGEAADKARAAGTREREREQAVEEASEQEAHENRDYSEDRIN